MYSAYKLNKQGYNTQPWCTPFPIWNPSVVPCPGLTVASWPAYRFLKRQVRWSGIPISFRIFQFIVIYTIEGFGIVNKAEIEVFLELSCFFKYFSNGILLSHKKWNCTVCRDLCCAESLSHVQLSATPWTAAGQAPLSMGILQASILEWVAMPSSRGSSRPRNRTRVSCIAGGFFTSWATRDVDGPEDHCTEWSKSEKQISNVNACMWNLEK